MKWEYKAEHFSDNPLLTYTEMLNLYGEEGWELVFILQNKNRKPGLCFFKRPLQEKNVTTKNPSLFDVGAEDFPDDGDRE